MKLQTTKSRNERPPDVGANNGGIGITNQTRVAGQINRATTAEKTTNWNAGTLASNIPQGNVYGRNTIEERSAPPEDVQFLWTSSISGPICVASRPMQSGAISSSMANFAEDTARKPKVSPQPSSPWSVVTLTSRESATGKSLSPQAEAAARVPDLNGIRSGKVSTLAIIIASL